MRFFDLEAAISDTEEDSEEVNEDDRGFLDESEPVATGMTSSLQKLLKYVEELRGQGRDEAEEAEAIAASFKERARKRRRVGPSPYEGEPDKDALRKQLTTRKDVVPEGLDVDDSGYEMYMIRTSNARVEYQIVKERLPSNCLAIYIPWLTDRVYAWVPSREAINKMFYARSRLLPPRGVVFRVPSSEQGLVFAMTATKFRIFRIGSWVEVLRGKFSGDLGIVESQDYRTGIVHVAVRERITHPSSSERLKRPTPAFATTAWLKKWFPDEPVHSRDDGTYRFRGRIYRNGLRIIRLKNDRVRPAYPLLHDVLPFRALGLCSTEDVEWYARRGDIVVVTDGPCKDFVGTVLDRLDGGVILQVHRIPTLDNGGREGREAEPVSSLRRQDVVLLLECAVDRNDQPGEIFVELRHIRRLMDVGDEVLIRIGRFSEQPALIIAQEGDILTVQINNEEPLLDISRFWVETVEGDAVFRPQEKKNDPIQLNDLVVVLGGPFQGRWLRVNGLSGDFAYVTLKYDDDRDQERLKEVQKHGLLSEDNDIDFFVRTVIEGDWIKDKVETRKRKSLKMPLRLLFKPTNLDLEKNILPLLTNRAIYAKQGRSQFEGWNVVIYSRDKSDRNTRFAKGLYGVVRSVDAEARTARVDYQGRQSTIPLRNLVSCDRIMCLDPTYPLTASEARRYSERIRQGKSIPNYSAMVPYRPPTPPAEQRAPLAEPVSDFSATGYWIFEPSVRSMCLTEKVGVRVRSKDRAGYITNELEDDHTACTRAHDKCRVRVHLRYSRTIIPTTVDVSDIDPCRPARKNSRVLQIRGLHGAPARILIATGVPRLREQPITVSEPGDEKRPMTMPAEYLTTLEDT